MILFRWNSRTGKTGVKNSEVWVVHDQEGIGENFFWVYGNLSIGVQIMQVYTVVKTQNCPV